jgi:hypothetical protein
MTEIVGGSVHTESVKYADYIDNTRDNKSILNHTVIKLEPQTS